jgi:hypothetical protein
MSYSSPRVVLPFLLILTVVSILCLPVHPWPNDGWFETQYLLFDLNPGGDNYSPVAVPALYYWSIHWIASVSGFDLRSEFYLASIGQNLMVWLSAVFVHLSIRTIGLARWAGWIATGFLVYLLAAGLAQSMWSENTVLLMLAAILYVNLRLRYAAAWSWGGSIVSAVLIALVVVTRITPIFLIPALAVLFWRRLPRAQYLGHLVIASIVTGVAVLAAMSSNEWRFGRFELTNSSGRHLWQGVMTFADSALRNSKEAASIKSFNPVLQGKNHWEIQIPPGYFTGDSIVERDDLLHRLAIQAIRAEPVTYVRVGLSKFVHTIFQPVFRLGFGERGEHPDPLNTDKLLSAPLGEGPSGAHRVASIVAAVFEYIYTFTCALYPVVVFLGITTTSLYALRALGSVFGFVSWRGLLALTAHLTVGFCSIYFILHSQLGPYAQLTLLPCLLILGAQVLVTFGSGSITPEDRTESNVDWRLWLFLGAMFFGSMWFSWQVELDVSRYALPYLPFLALLCAMGLEYIRFGWCCMEQLCTPPSLATRKQSQRGVV